MAPGELIIIVDDWPANVAAATRLGIHGVLHVNAAKSITAIIALLAARGRIRRRQDWQQASPRATTSHRPAAGLRRSHPPPNSALRVRIETCPQG